MIYRARADRGLHCLLVAALMCVPAGLGVALVVLQGNADLALFVVLGALPPALGLVWHGAGIPTAIVWPKGGAIRFKARRRLPELQPAEVHKVYYHRMRGWSLEHSRGLIRLTTYRDWDDFMARLQKHHPAVHMVLPDPYSTGPA